MPLSYILNDNKNAIQKINDTFFLVLLNKIGFIIINNKTKEITKKLIDEKTIILWMENRLINDYLYFYVIEKNVKENKLNFKKYISNLSDFFSNSQIKLITGENYLLRFENAFNRVGILMEQIDKNNIDINNIKIVLVVGDNKLIIFDYYS